MANKGVYSREDNSPEGVGRSVQDLSGRNTFDMRFMEIYPNFADFIYPNEKFEITTTNFLRTIPMVAPVLSRIRIVQRFYAVPLRIMWQPWERYIDISNEDYDFTLEEPYLVNCNANFKVVANGSGEPVTSSVTGSAASVPAFVYVNQSSSPSESVTVRGFRLAVGSVVPDDFPKSGDGCGSLVVAPHDLLDYFSAPLNVNCAPYTGIRSSRFSAYKACAYQMAYSFGYRLPNVQKRVDDYYQMCANNELSSGNYVVLVGNSGQQILSVPQALASSSVPDFAKKALGYSWIVDNNVRSWPQNLAASSESDAVLRTSWDKTELFPLKAGANASLQAWRLNQYGSLEFVPSNISLTRKRFANWSMDYFTSCNPWQQRGLEAQISVSGLVNLTNLSIVNALKVGVDGDEYGALKGYVGVYGYDSDVDYDDALGNIAVYSGNRTISDLRPKNQTADDGTLVGFYSSTPVDNLATLPNQSVQFSSPYASATGLYVTPSNFRFAMALQRIKEMSARTDGRYQHYLSKFFGSYVKNDQIDYPQFLGGFVQDLNVDTVTQTSESGSTDLGTLAGNGISAKQGYKITYYAKEHCVIIGMIHIIPDTEYVGGLDRQDNTSDPYDWMLPQFSGLSEQPVFNEELAFSGQDSVDKQAFGYQPYLNYLRGKQNRACGAFRDSLNYTGSYEYYKPWIVQRDFGYKFDSDGNIVHNVPTLSDEFLSGRGTTDNSMFSVADDSKMYPFMCDSYFNVRAVRTIPARGIPKI